MGKKYFKVLHVRRAGKVRHIVVPIKPPTRLKPKPEPAPLDVCDRPWFTDPAIAWLETISPRRVFEWGCGRSTIYFAQQAECITVEHDPRWCDRLRAFLYEHEIPCDLRHVRPEQGHRPVRDVADPLMHSSDSEEHLRERFRGYAQTIQQEGLFDIVSVDGRARPSCIHYGQEHVAPGGWLILDNSDRPRYRRAMASVPRSWSRQDFPQPNWQDNWTTTVWCRPL